MKILLPALAGFLVQGVLALKLAEFFLFEPLRRVPLLFFRGIVAVLALGALKSNDFAHDVDYLMLPRINPEPSLDGSGCGLSTAISSQIT
jgi:hypothetical protein